jgi:uncharacterized protein
MKVFADAFFYMALINRQDAFHKKAAELSESLPGPIYTTHWVLTEVGDAFSRPRDRGLFLKLLELIEKDQRIEVVPATKTLFEHGIELFANRPDKYWSLTDCISFIVMDQQGVTEALTGDRHFTQAGFVALLAEPASS